MVQWGGSYGREWILIEMTVPKSKARDIAYIAVFTALIAVGAWIAIPTPVRIDFTLQTLGVFLAVGVLGGRRGTLAVAAYLLLGAVGAPVFAGFRGGPSVLLGSTGGYLLGFIGTALVYWLLERLWGAALPLKVLACLLGMVVYYAFGTAWFLVVYARTTGPIGLSGALAACVVPFVIPDLVKAGLALLLSRRVQKYLK